MKQLVLASYFLFLSLYSFGQSGMSFHYLHTLPIGDYKENLLHNPSGLSLDYFKHPFENKKLQIGISASVSMYQNEDFEGDMNVSEFKRVYVKTNEDDCLYTYQGFIRYHLNDESHKLRPYVQTQLGGVTYFSTLTIHEDLSDNNYKGSNTNHGTTYLLGTGGGLSFFIYEALSIDLSVNYNKTGETTYRTSPDITKDVLYRIDLKRYMRTSKVDHIALKLGLNMIF